MYNSTFIFTLIISIGIFTGCSKSPKVSNNKQVKIIEMNGVITKNINIDPIDILISKIKNKHLTSAEERKVYNNFNAVSNTYPIIINDVKIESYDRTLKYDYINAHNLTACIRTKNVIILYNQKKRHIKVCQTTNYDWIIR